MLQYKKGLMPGAILIMYMSNSFFYGYTDLEITVQSYNYFIISKC
jgi:hypothetical protein